MPSMLSQLLWRNCIQGVYLQSAWVQPVPQRGVLRPRVPHLLQEAGVLSPSRKQGKWDPEQTASEGSCEGRSVFMATKLLSLCRLTGSCTGLYLLNYHAAVMSKSKLGLQEQCYVLCGILLFCNRATELLGPLHSKAELAARTAARLLCKGARSSGSSATPA